MARLPKAGVQPHATKALEPQRRQTKMATRGAATRVACEHCLGLATPRRMRRLLHEHHHCDHAEHDQDEPDDQHRQQSALVPGRTGRVNVEVLSRDHCHSLFRPMTPLAEAADVSAGADRRQGPLPLCGFANRIRVAGCGHPDATGSSRHDLVATAIGWRSKPPDWGTMDHLPSHARRRADRS